MVIAESAVNLYPFFNAKFFCQVPGVCLFLKNEAFVTEFMPISRTAWKNIKVCIYLYQGDFHADIDRHYWPVEGSRETIHIFSFDCTWILLLLLRGYNVLSIFPIWARPLWKYWLAPLWFHQYHPHATGAPILEIWASPYFWSGWAHIANWAHYILFWWLWQ